MKNKKIIIGDREELLSFVKAILTDRLSISNDDVTCTSHSVGSQSDNMLIQVNLFKKGVFVNLKENEEYVRGMLTNVRYVHNLKLLVKIKFLNGYELDWEFSIRGT